MVVPGFEGTPLGRKQRQYQANKRYKENMAKAKDAQKKKVASRNRKPWWLR